MSSEPFSPSNHYQAPPAPAPAALDRATWNRVFKSLGERLAALEAKRTELQDLINDLSFNGQARLDEAIVPLITQTQAQIDELQRRVAATIAANGAIIETFQEDIAEALASLNAQIAAVEARVDTILQGGIPAADVAESGTRVFVSPAQRDAIGGKIDKAGGAFTGHVDFAVGTAGRAPLSIPPGVAPSAPVNGDLWATATAIFARIANVTRTIYDSVSLPIATQAQAEAGTASTALLMPPLRTRQNALAAIAEEPGVARAGDVVLTSRSLEAPWLKMDGSKYLKSAYPTLAPLFDQPYPFDMPRNVPGSFPRTGSGQISFRIGDLAFFVVSNELTVFNFKTGQVGSLVFNDLGTSDISVTQGTIGPDGRLYVPFNIINANSTYIKAFTLSAAGMPTAQVTHSTNPHSSSGGSEAFLSFVDGFFYLAGSRGVARSATAASNSWTETYNQGIVSDGPWKADTGHLFCFIYQGAGNQFLIRSSDNGLTWSRHALPLPNIQNNPNLALETAFAVATPYPRRRGTHLFAWKGKVYCRIAGSSSGTTSYLFRVTSAGGLLLFHNSNMRQGGWVDWGDKLSVGSAAYNSTSKAFGELFDENENTLDFELFIKSVFSNASSLSFSSGEGSSQNGEAFSPTGGIATIQPGQSGRITGSAPGHNQETEFRLPKLVRADFNLTHYVRAA